MSNASFYSFAKGSETQGGRGFSRGDFGSFNHLRPESEEDKSWPRGTDGPLIIDSGTVTINPGIYDYSFVSIAAGAYLNIAADSGTWTIIGCKGLFINNGTIVANKGEHTGGTFSTSAPDGTLLSVSIVQSAGGNGGDGGRFGPPTVAPGGSTNSGNGGGGGGGSGGNINQGGTGGTASSTNSGSGGSGGLNNSNTPGTGGGGASSTAIYSSPGGNGNNGSSGGGGGGGSGGTRGRHGQALYIRTKNVCIGTGSVLIEGSIGGNGGTGGSGSSAGGPNVGGGGGGGGGGAGGSGGILVVKNKTGSLSWTVSNSGGLGGSSGGGGSQPSGSPTAQSGPAGSNGATGFSLISTYP